MVLLGDILCYLKKIIYASALTLFHIVAINSYSKALNFITVLRTSLYMLGELLQAWVITSTKPLVVLGL
jgi:hypothetical protein